MALIGRGERFWDSPLRLTSYMMITLPRPSARDVPSVVVSMAPTNAASDLPGSETKFTVSRILVWVVVRHHVFTSSESVGAPVLPPAAPPVSRV